jgi:hypothetical protein
MPPVMLVEIKGIEKAEKGFVRRSGCSCLNRNV